MVREPQEIENPLSSNFVSWKDLFLIRLGVGSNDFRLLIIQEFPNAEWNLISTCAIIHRIGLLVKYITKNQIL